MSDKTLLAKLDRKIAEARLRTAEISAGVGLDLPAGAPVAKADLDRVADRAAAQEAERRAAELAEALRRHRARRALARMGIATAALGQPADARDAALNVQWERLIAATGSEDSALDALLKSANPEPVNRRAEAVADLEKSAEAGDDESAQALALLAASERQRARWARRGQWPTGV